MLHRTTLRPWSLRKSCIRRPIRPIDEAPVMLAGIVHAGNAPHHPESETGGEARRSNLPCTESALARYRVMPPCVGECGIETPPPSGGLGHGSVRGRAGQCGNTRRDRSSQRPRKTRGLDGDAVRHCPLSVRSHHSVGSPPAG